MSVVAGFKQDAVEVPAPDVIVPSPHIKGIASPALQKKPVVHVVDAANPLLSAYVPAGVSLQIVFPSDVDNIPQGQGKASSAKAGQYEPAGQLFVAVSVPSGQ